MDNDLEELRQYVDAITDDDRDLASLGGPVLHYGLFLRRILNELRPGFIAQRDFNTPTTLQSGDALTPWHAAACMEDRLRTAVFIRGAIRSVEIALAANPQRPLHLVEAGCEPLGTLVLPLLAQFHDDELTVSLADLHQESIECIEIMLGHFGFSSRVRQLLVGDVTRIPFDSPADLILTETMNTALSQEPQVAISRSLMQRDPAAILIPQSIRIDLELLDLQSELSQFPPQVAERTFLATVFELNRRTAAELSEETDLISVGEVIMPDQIAPGLTPCLTTNICVFDDVQISNYETQISHPVPLVQSEQSHQLAGITIKFNYRISDSPGFLWKFVEPA